MQIVLREKQRRKTLALITVLIVSIMLLICFFNKHEVEVVNLDLFKQKVGNLDLIKHGASSSAVDYPLRINEYRTCSKGKGISKKWLRQEFAHFIKVYEQRPKDENKWGTKMMHQFALWATVR